MHKFNNVRPGVKLVGVTSAFSKGIYRELPKPTGKAPYRLHLEEVLGKNLSKSKMVFHTMGDSGGIKTGDPQLLVAEKMESQFSEATKKEDKPLFLYHLGDVVYFYGKESEYTNQFYEPYMHYPAPIMGIPGNHDGDIDPADKNPAPSLDAFVKVFCDKKPKKLPISGESVRTTMTQPNVYWTLVAPMANIIGLYTNVPEHGEIRDEQRKWFIGELKNAQLERKNKALIITLHHPIYSVDNHHGSSTPMREFLEKAFAEANVYPDLILSGHVHNYQRFTRIYNGTQQVPVIVAGAGGYHHLHYVDSNEEPVYVPNNSFFKDTVMESFCDNRHGFLRLTIVRVKKTRKLIGEYFTAPRPQEPWRGSAEMYDYFEVDLTTNKLTNIKNS